MSLRDLGLGAASWVLGHVVPKDPTLVVFGGRHYGGNTAPLFERCGEAGLRGVWLSREPGAAGDGRERADAASLRGAWIAARAGGVVLTHSLGDFAPIVFPSRRTKLFNVYHGMPIKKIARADPGFVRRSYARRNLREFARYEAMFATSAAMARIFAETFGLPLSRVHQTGQPRTDVLFREPSLAFLDRYAPPLPAHERRVLYCPTWREGTAVRLFPFSDRDLDALEGALADLGAVLFVRTHPNDAGRLERRRERIVPMQGDVVREVTDVLGAFDVLVTDYSSVYYDWLLLDRPTVFLPYDLASYAEAPGFYLPFEQVVSGPTPDTQRGFVAALGEALERPVAHAHRRAAVRALVHAHVDGDATRRVLEVIARRATTRRGRASGMPRASR